MIFMKLKSLEEIKLSALENNIGSMLICIDLETEAIKDLEKENLITPNNKMSEVITTKKNNIANLQKILNLLILKRDNLYLELNPQNKV